MYRLRFKVHRRDISEQAFSYMTGLLKCDKGKKNMERMKEEIPDIEYHHYQHFISNSPWDASGVIGQVGEELSELLEGEKHRTGNPTGLIIDESAHVKSGKESVGVARQYAGVSRRSHRQPADRCAASPRDRVQALHAGARLRDR